MKSGLNPGRRGKFAPSPPLGRHEHLIVRRADLLSLIREMESNRQLQAASWQIESLRESLRTIEAKLSHSRTVAHAAGPAPHPRRSAHPAREGNRIFKLL